MRRTKPNDILQSHRKDPSLFVREILGQDAWDKQKEILESVRDHKRTTVRSGNACGKTMAAVYAALWFLYTTKDSIVIVTSPTLHQMTEVFFRTLAKVHAEAKLPLGGDISKTSLSLGEKHFLKGFCYREGSNAPPEGIQGHHSDRGILFVIDECSAVPDTIYDAIEGSLNTENAKLLMIGNPLRLSGEFYRSHTSASEYNRIHISALDLPNVKEEKLVIPGLATLEGVEDMRERWGEDNDQYKIRVLGDFPSIQEDTIIAMKSVEDAIANKETGVGEIVIGVDVARFGSDFTAFVKRQGNQAEVLETIARSDLMYVAGRCIHWLRKFPNATMKIDSIGSGGGVVDRLKEHEDLAERVQGVSVAEKAEDSDRYANLRAELWFFAKEAVENASFCTHNSWTQLAVPTYHINSSGKLQVEPKDQIKKRSGSSPDVADAYCLTFHTKPESDVPFVKIIS